MPRYFFDTNDGDMFAEDDEGLEFPDSEAARRAAVAALPDLARDKLPDGDRRDFTVSVRDEAGMIVYSASLNLNGEWHTSPSARSHQM